MKQNDRAKIISSCKKLLAAYKDGSIGDTTMPEDSHPKFLTNEDRLAYFTLPMALNYQRDSYTLWKSALKTYDDLETKEVFDVKNVVDLSDESLRQKLTKHKLALQPNKHIQTWEKLSQTFSENWGSIEKFFEDCDSDFLKVRDSIQHKHKKDFPYLSGPKIFNYWSFVINTFGGIDLINKEYIEIAPDTHVTKCSVLLGVISKEEAEKMTKDQISARWREVLDGSGITPIEMHPPLWFWSKNNFKYKLK
jgi:phosphoribosyl-AMP cyclohydrolase